MSITLALHLQCDHCEKSQTAHQTLSFIPSVGQTPIMLDVSEDDDWEVIQDTLYCSDCAELLKYPICDA